MTDRFRRDNTEGYDVNDLAALNAAWQQIVPTNQPETDIAILSMHDHWAEQLLAEFDAGKRGNDLTLWYFEGH